MCVLSAYVCDGHRDCDNGADEAGCGGGRALDDYDKVRDTGQDPVYFCELDPISFFSDL